jgi:hypothetical protein
MQRDNIDLRAAVNRKFSRHIGVGTGCNCFRTRVDANLPLFNGSVYRRCSSPQICVIATL